MQPAVMTAEQRTAKNAAASARGIAACPGCGDSKAWKPFHVITYHRGRMVSEASPEGKPAEFDVEKHTEFLCEDCYGKMTEAEILDHLDQLALKKTAALKPVIRDRDTTGKFVEREKDRERFEAEVAAIAADHELIRLAILRGN